MVDSLSKQPDIVNIDKSKPDDFEGHVATNNDLPSDSTLKKVENYMVLDRNGKSHTFKSLYTGRNVPRRVLVVFIRHFFCGQCQEYVSHLSESITPEALLALPVSTFIAIVGCGDPALIQMYADQTSCPFPIYTDPTRSIFEALGMIQTLALGERPAYTRRSVGKSSLDSIVQIIKSVPKGLATKGGSQKQVGGEFLFEPRTLSTPMASPRHEPVNSNLNGLDTAALAGIDSTTLVANSNTDKSTNNGAATTTSDTTTPIITKTHRTSIADDEADESECSGVIEEKIVTWCNRMKSTRDHAEVPEVMEVLGLDGHGKPIEDTKRWNKAVENRKGRGASMAPDLGQLSLNKKIRQTQESQNKEGGAAES